jgi:hypothetical protein
VLLDNSETSPLHDADSAAELHDRLSDLLAARSESTFSVVGTAPPRLLVDATADPRPVLEALTAVPSAGPAADAAPLVEALCAHTPATVVVIGFPVAPLEAKGCDVVHFPVPEPATEVLTDLVASMPASTGDVWLHVRARGEATTAVVEHEGATVGQVRLSGDATREGVARIAAPPGATLAVRLDGTDHPTSESSVALPRLPPVRVLVRTHNPEGYLARVVGVHPRLQALVIPPGAAGPAEEADLLLTDAPEPVTDSARVVAVFGRGAAELGVPPGPVTTRPTVTLTAPDAPLLDLVGLDTLHIATTPTLLAPADATILASTARGPIAVHRPLPDGRHAVVLGPGLATSDLPLRADFVHLVANLVDLAAPVGAPPAPAPHRVQPPLDAFDAGAPPASPQRPGVWIAVALLFLAFEALWQVVRRARRSTP